MKMKMKIYKLLHFKMILNRSCIFILSKKCAEELQLSHNIRSHWIQYTVAAFSLQCSQFVVKVIPEEELDSAEVFLPESAVALAGVVSFDSDFPEEKIKKLTNF